MGDLLEMPVAVPIAVIVYPINVGQGDAILLEVEYDDGKLFCVLWKCIFCDACSIDPTYNNNIP